MSTSITATVDLETDQVNATASGGAVVPMRSDSDRDAPGPKELVLVALAGCTAVDVASILRKKRQRPERYEVEVIGEAVDDPPRIYHSISVEHRVSGAVQPEALRRSIELSATRYCAVSAMLSAVARVEHRYLLLDAAGVTHSATVAIVGPDREIRVIS